MAAFDLPPDIDVKFKDLSTAINTVFEVAVSIAGVIFLLLLLFGGFQYLNSAGSEDMAKKAQQTMMNALIGLIVVVLAYPVGNWIICQIQGGLFCS